ncbi:hypothetical protein CEP51_007417 [Fusarium floridanum]|uniref:Uncharacterized protein n=1 Tax=Fusarium floridanum TaxID=1325733 RepID=A0A428RPF2_9HYPO|nr:hypothetical protein CEP51_007417 [Fusarium floridanum]
MAPVVHVIRSPALLSLRSTVISLLFTVTYHTCGIGPRLPFLALGSLPQPRHFPLTSHRFFCPAITFHRSPTARMSDDLELARQFATEHMSHVLSALRQNPLDLSAITLEKSPILPIGFLTKTQHFNIQKAIVERIFMAVGETWDTAEDCLYYCADTLERESLLSATILPLYNGYNAIKSCCEKAIHLSASTGKQPCLPAPLLVSLIAVLDYRKVMLARPDDAILEILDTHRVLSWLSIAIKVYPRISKEPFVIVENESALHPIVRRVNGI